MACRPECSFRPSASRPATPLVPIPTAGSPNRGFIALELIGHGPGPVARCPCQDDPSALHLKPRQALAPSDLQELRFVAGTNAESIGFSAAHGRIPPVDLVYHYQLSHVREFRAGFLSRDTRALRYRQIFEAQPASERENLKKPYPECTQPSRFQRQIFFGSIALAKMKKRPHIVYRQSNEA